MRVKKKIHVQENVLIGVQSLMGGGKDEEEENKQQEEESASQPGMRACL